MVGAVFSQTENARTMDLHQKMMGCHKSVHSCAVTAAMIKLYLQFTCAGH